MPSKADPRVTKRRITATRVRAVQRDGHQEIQTTQTVDYVDSAQPGLIDATVAHLQELGWEAVEVSEEPDAGPGGYDGATHVPHGNYVEDRPGEFRWVPFDHHLAGTFLAPTGEEYHPEDPAHPNNGGVSPNNPVATMHALGISPTDLRTASVQLNAHPRVQAHVKKQQKLQQKG
jgi:hypothetical protein